MADPNFITQLELHPIITVSVIDVGLSDHHLLSWEIRTVYTTIPPERVIRRPWRLLDIEALRSAITTSTLCHPEQWPADVNNFAELYDTELTVILDGLIPARPVVRRKRASHVWYDRHCREAKRLTLLLVGLNVLMHQPQDVAMAVLYRRQRMMQPLV